MNISSIVVYAFVFTLLLLQACSSEKSEMFSSSDWSTYLGDKRSSQYSSLDQINTQNIQSLQLAWQYDEGEANKKGRSQIQCNPLVIDGIVYGTTATLKLIALDGVTGLKIWTFDPYDGDFTNFGMGVNRGLVYYPDKTKERIFYAAGPNIYAIDLSSGTLITDFGNNGSIDLHDGLGRNVDSLYISANTPGIIYDNLLIMGSRVSESTGAAPGHIRAFDVITGAQEWIFHTIPNPGEFGYDTWPKDAYQRIGGANAWAGLSVDEKNGIVYCPTGSAAYDFYGGDRKGDNLFANCILALNARTGERLWHYQTIHHDIWDKDLPAPPNLMDLEIDGKSVPALAQITKNGFLFVLNRLTGAPLHEIDEIEVPQSELDGEHSSPIQPYPKGFPPFARTSLTIQDLATRSDETEKYAKAIWSNTNHKGGMFEPPSEKGTIIFPGFDGAGEWGGAAFDPKEKNLIVNSNEVPWRNIMDKIKPTSPGEQVYISKCQTCHAADLKGGEMFGKVPSLLQLKDRLTKKEVTEIVKNGKGVMPSFSYLSDEKIQSVYEFINGLEDESEKTTNSDWPYPYAMRGYEKLYAPDGYPIINPPWGQLTSINMEERKINWQIPLGEHESLSKNGIPITGTENYGGPVVTAGGLIFIAATMDEKIRAFRSDNGEELWSYKLPAAGYATPAMYEVEGKQYLVIACGGGKLGTGSGDAYLAFSL